MMVLGNRPFTQQEFVHQRHQPIFHIRANARDQLDVEGAQQFFKQLFGDIPFVSKQFAKEFADQLGNRLTIIHIPRGQPQIEQLASVIEDQVQLETKKPAYESLATLGQPRKDLVSVDSWVLAHG